MNGVNLNSPDLKLVQSSEQAPARASTSPRAAIDDGAALQAPTSSVSDAGNDVVAGAGRSGSDEAQIAREKQESLGQAVSQLNDFVQNVQRDLQFEVDENLGQTIVKVIDNETKEVIRQIPDEVAMRLAENLHQNEPLTLFNIKV